MAAASEVLAIARAELGVKEFPAGSNKVKYNDWYYGRAVSGVAYPWCMAFVQWCFAQAGASELLPVRTASCGALLRAAKQAGLWVSSGFKPGDVALYDFTGNGAADHVGIVESVTASGVVAIEGNTGAGNDANGGCVMRRERTNRQILGALRPRYKEEKNMDNTPSAAGREAVEWCLKNGIMQGNTDGDLMLHSPVTREQMCIFLHRLAKLNILV